MKIQEMTFSPPEWLFFGTFSIVYQIFLFFASIVVFFLDVGFPSSSSVVIFHRVKFICFIFLLSDKFWVSFSCHFVCSYFMCHMRACVFCAWTFGVRVDVDHFTVL